MGDIKIADIKKQFRTIAENADKVENGGNNNKILDGEEISVFKKYATFAGATDKDFEKMGLAVEKQNTVAQPETVAQQEAAKTVTNPQVAEKPAGLTEAEQKNVNKRVKQAIKELVKQGASNEGFVDALVSKFAKVQDGRIVKDPNTGNPVIQESFVQAINEIREVVAKIDIDKITTKKEAKSIKDEAEKAFPKATDVQKAFIDNLKDWAEAAATSKRLATIRKMYNEKLNGGHNYQITLDAVEKDLKTKKDGKKEWDVDYTKDAFKLLEKDAKQLALSYERAVLNTSWGDVLEEEDRVLQQLENGEITEEEANKALQELDKDEKTARALRSATTKSEIRAVLRDTNVDGDKFLEDAYERRLSGKRSKTIKHDMEEKARKNRSADKIVSTLKTVKVGEVDGITISKDVPMMSEEDMKADLKKRVNGNTFWHGVRQYTLISSFGNMSSKDAEKLMSKLKGNTNYYDPETKTFDLAAIRKDVVTDIGDMVLDPEEDKNESELENLKQHMNARMGLTGKDKLNTSEARALVKLIEGDIGHGNIAKAGAVGALTGLGAALAGLVGGWVAYHDKLVVTQRVDLSLSSAAYQEVKSSLDKIGIQYIESDLSAGKKGITILQQVIRGDKQTLNALFGAINGLGIGAATGILTALIVGQQEHEKTCMPVGDYDIHNTRYTDPEEYKQYINNRYSHNPIKAGAICTMVDKYVDFYGKDAWHIEYQNDIRLAAGLGSTMNPNECMEFFSQKKYVRPTGENNNENEETQDAVTLVPHCTEYKTESKLVTIQRLKKQEDWGVMAEKYDCLKKNHPEIYNSHRVKTRYMKAIQAIKADDDYKLSIIKKYADISLAVKLRGKGHEKEDVQNLRMAFQKAIAEGKVDPERFNVETFIKLIVYPEVQAQKIPTIIDDTRDNETCEYNQKKKVTKPAYTPVKWTGAPTAPEGDVSVKHSTIPGYVDVVDKKGKVIKTEATVEKANKWAQENKLTVTNPDAKDC